VAENKSVQGDCCGCVYRDERERCRRFPPVVVMFAHRDVDRHEWLSSEFGFPPAWDRCGEYRAAPEVTSG
jgi:hypothetical protein